MGKIIEITKLHKKYNNNTIIKDLDLVLDPGRFITLIGSNGAGKSTLMRLMAGVEKPDSGAVNVLGEKPYDYSFSRRSEVFFIHENYQLEFGVDLLNMLVAYREIYPRWSNEEFNRLMKSRKISFRKNFKDLSRGQKMQFLLMVALAAKPEVLFLDEITSVIDIESQKFFLQELKNYCEAGGTVVLTTNILSEVNQYTDHLLLIQEGELKVNSSSKEMRSEFAVLREEYGNPLFGSRDLTFIRKDEEGNKLYICYRSFLTQNPEIAKFVVSESILLEDVLMLHFSLSHVTFDEELSA